MGHINGKIALITGASSGIGEKTARSLCEAGVRVICSGRRARRLEAIAAKLGGDAIALELDVTSERSVETLLDRLPKEWWDIDILVNNAGHDIGGRRLFHEGTVQEWSAIIETNVIGLMRVTRVVLEGMVRRDSGHIVNIGSIAGIQTSSLCSVSETLRLDYANTSIKVSEVLPGMVKTEFAVTRFADEGRAAKYYEDFGICLEPEDIARSVVFTLDQPTDVVIAQVVVVPTRR